MRASLVLCALTLMLSSGGCGDDDGNAVTGGGESCDPLLGPADVVVEYFGAIEDGRRVVVIRPTDDWTYDDFRVFIGAPSHVLEREVQSVTRERDGGSTTIELTLDGEPATLSFPVVLADGGFMAGPATLEHDDQTLDIDLLDKTVSALLELAFFCR